MEFPDDAPGAGTPAEEPAQHPPAPGPGLPEPDFSLTAPEPEPYHSPVTDAAGYGTPAAAPPPKPPRPPDPPDDDPEEDGMARMSFMEHLEELRKRLLYAIGGIGVAFFLCLLFSDQLWDFVRAPAESALRNLKVD